MLAESLCKCPRTTAEVDNSEMKFDVAAEGTQLDCGRFGMLVMRQRSRNNLERMLKLFLAMLTSPWEIELQMYKVVFWTVGEG